MDNELVTQFRNVAKSICGHTVNFEDLMYDVFKKKKEITNLIQTLEKNLQTDFDIYCSDDWSRIEFPRVKTVVKWLESHIIPFQSVSERKFCLVGNSYFGITERDPYDYGISKILNYIKYTKFGHIPPYFTFKNPAPNTLYVVHPFDDKLYIPYEGSDVFLLNEKVHDFIMFAAALGAKKVKAYAQVRHSNVSSYSSSSSVSGSVGSRFGGVSGSYNSSSTNYEALAMSSTFNFEREFSGNERLDVLDRIPWYKHESIWHQLKDERELFGTKSFKESISTSSMRTINNSNREAIKADLKLLFANVSGSYESTINSMVETQDDLIETIEVEF